VKFYIRLPDGSEVGFEKEPISKERFEMICWLIGIFMVGSVVLQFFGLMVGK